MLKVSLLNATALAAGSLLTALPAIAQVAQPTVGTAAVPQEAQNKADAGAVGSVTDDSTAPTDAIVVTGTRIAAPNLTSTIPVTSISGEQFFKTGNVSIGDTLDNLPQIRSTFSQSNSTRFLGTAGLSLLDLRGLGTQRTLVLINGRRQVGADVLYNGVSVDVNTIPTDLIERTDLVTGGNSAVYGSDAIAGAVNFVLKQNFDGFQIRAQDGLSKYHDAGSQYVSVLAGKNFAEGRGNIALNLEYAHQSALYASERSAYAQQNGFVIVDQDLATDANVVNNSDGNPDRTFFRDIRSSTYSNGGLVSFNSPTGACGRDTVLNATTGLGRTFSCNYVFQANGNLVPETGQRVGLGSGTATPTGSFIGGNGDNFRDGQQLGLQPRQVRYAANLIGHYEFSDALVPFVEAKFVRVKTLGSASGPAFTNGGTFGVGSAEQYRLDNPFLSAQARTLITQQLVAGGANAASITGATRFSLRKNLVDLGVRQEQSQRDTFRIVGGLRGTFNDDWKYEISGNYGQLKEDTRVLGNLNVQRYLLATDSVRNAAGQIVCRAQTNGGSSAIDYGNTPSQSVLNADIAACVPLNPFGTGNISDAARNYVIQDTVSHGKITQTDITGFVSGDSSQLFELPGGPVYFSLGGEYRRETLFYDQDPIVQNGYTFYNAIPTFKAPSFVVKEAFGELRAPLLKDLPFIKELTLTGQGRIAHYKGATGTVYAYGGGVDWIPFTDLHLRGSYQRSVRAPNLSDLYTPQGQNFGTVVDPCSARNISTGTTSRAANCQAAGIPASYDYVYQASLELVSGGNPSLKAETSDSYTFGGVITPSILPGLSVSLDYYKITVKNVITAPTAQQILNACYDLPSLSNPFCGLFQRNPGNAAADPYRIVEGTLQQTLLNYASYKTRGIDMNFAFRKRLGDESDIGTSVVYTHVIQRDNFIDPTRPTYANQILGELGDPKDAFNWSVDLKVKRIQVSYQLRYLSHMVLNTYENLFSVQGRPPENPDYADIRYYPSVVYQNIRVGLNATKDYQLYVGVDNLTNRLPPLGATGVGDGSGIYDNRGRYFYVGVSGKF